jgi:hypothetical protein
MSEAIITAGNSIQCKGRNGYFQHAETRIHLIDLNVPSIPATVYVSVYSRRTGDHAPIVFQGDPQEILAYFRDIVTTLERDVIGG